MPDHATGVTAAGIARIAGVGHAAVSTWRRRHTDFPKPVGGTGTSPYYDLADVEEWLGRQGKLTEVLPRERAWQRIEAHPAGTADALRHVGAALLRMHDRPRARPPEDTPLTRAVVGLAAGTGPGRMYDFLLGRHLEATSRHRALTPAPLAELMAALVGPVESVLDPACGTGVLLRAAEGDPGLLYGQELDADLADLTALSFALGAGSATGVRIRAGDSLRADAFPGTTVDAVLSHPPFGERDWGHGELAHDSRWEYGFPPRTESELAWAQHSLTHVRPGGTVVLLMPPAAASRRSGRRIRADLLRRGALRAVIALPAGSAPPHSVPLHLWVLRRPDTRSRPPHLLLVDGAGPPGRVHERAPWQTIRTTVLEAWRSFEDGGGVAQERFGAGRTRSVIDLLDDDVDLAPARHVPPVPGGGGAGPTRVRERFTETLRRTGEPAPVPAGPAYRPATTLGELVRAGALALYPGGAGTAAGGTGPAVLTEHDVITGGPPTGTLPEGPDEPPALTEPGDVVVPVLGHGAAARVIDDTTAGAAPGRDVHLLRPDPAVLDPWFLAGFLRGTAGDPRTGDRTTTATLLDVRRLRLPRLPLADQQRYGERFRVLAAFEDTLRLAGRLGEQLAQGLYDKLTDGT